jgi:hypothetical protein
MELLSNIRVREELNEAFLLLGLEKIKYTSKAYGWSDDTLLLYPEENEKYMFFMCKNKQGTVDHDRRFIYLIKPHSVQFKENEKFKKINLQSDIVIKYKDPYITSEELLKSYKEKHRSYLKDKFTEILQNI